jgi:hypothetical protein
MADEQQQQQQEPPQTAVKIVNDCAHGNRAFRKGDVAELDADTAGRLISLGNAKLISPESAPPAEQQPQQ